MLLKGHEEEKRLSRPGVRRMASEERGRPEMKTKK